MPVIDSLITNRTMYDALELESLLENGINPPYSHKGAYNASDLGRVGEAIDYIKVRLYEAGLITDESEFDVSYTLPDTEINLIYEQGGSGNPSPENIRGIYPAIKLSDIGDIYGGVLDVPNNTLTVTHGRIILADINWWMQTNYGFTMFYAFVPDANASVSGVTSIYNQTTSGFNSNFPNYSWRPSGGSKRINFRDNRYTASTDFKASLTDVPFVFELAEPIIYQLTDIQIAEAARQIGNKTISVKQEYRQRYIWEMTDIPTMSQMEKILDSLRYLKDKVRIYRSDIVLPETMRKLNYLDANRIERLLLEADKAVTNIKLSYRLYSGRTVAGVNCLP